MSYTRDDLLSLHHLSSADHPDHPYSSWPSIPPHPLGRLIPLTPEITAQASREIRTGTRFALDHPILPSYALLNNRLAASHDIIRCDGGPATKSEAKEKGEWYNPCFDDIVTFNTQSSTQWDYFLHFSYPGSGLFYGGLTADDIQTHKTGQLGVGAIARAGGVQTRALLIDIPLYLSDHNLPPLDPLSFPSSTTIDLSFLQGALEHFNLEPRVGDVLLVRTGFEDALAADKIRINEGENTHLIGNWAGVQASRETLEWIWQTGLVAVGSDNPTFEEWYPKPPAMALHPILLSGMGIMIGELMALNKLAEECKRLKRWSFFFSSCPVMLDGAVASPPNAVAIF